jgi:hypothetical protein
MRHQGQCGGQLLHSEDYTTDYYRCVKCGTAWEKKKRRAKKDNGMRRASDGLLRCDEPGCQLCAERDAAMEHDKKGS